jgi:hypothetical protein
MQRLTKQGYQNKTYYDLFEQQNLFFAKVTLLVLSVIRFSFLELHFLAQIAAVYLITESGQQWGT